MYSIREISEKRELEQLSPKAMFAAQSRGRQRAETECDLRTVFQRDRDRITHSKSFRRLKHKTQVFIAPSQDHYRTRLTHALEVSQISRTIGRALRLNEDLIEAIALGHDVGHTPFGHSGEQIIRNLIGHFEHNEQSLRVVDYIEKQGAGLNLTWEVRDGILNHTGSGIPATLEGQIVKICDRVGYLCHDIDDAMRAGILTVDSIPSDICEVLGNSPSHMLTTMVKNIIDHSQHEQSIIMGETALKAMNQLREFMFSSVYHSPPLQKERDRGQRVVAQLFEAFTECPELLPEEHYKKIEECGRVQTVVDYIASMTDNYAVKVFQDLFVPSPYRW